MESKICNYDNRKKYEERQVERPRLPCRWPCEQQCECVGRSRLLEREQRLCELEHELRLAAHIKRNT